MSGKRITLDLFVPTAIYDAIPSAKKLAFRDAVRDLKALAVKVNEGSPNEEMTVVAKMHDCRHDENGVCGPEVDI
jgi:hypothetical protein